MDSEFDAMSDCSEVSDDTVNDCEINDYLLKPSEEGNIIFANEDEGLKSRTDFVEISDDLDDDGNMYIMPNDLFESNSNRVNGKFVYALHVFASTKSGRKIKIDVYNIPVSFDICCRTPEDLEKANVLCGENERIIKSTEMFKSKPLFGMEENKIDYIRLCFDSTIYRNIVLDLANTKCLELASDDKFPYYRKVLRENRLALSKWLLLVRPKLLKPNVYEINLDRIVSPPGDFRGFKDRSIIMTWDIETYSFNRMGEVPKAENEKDHIFCICSTFHFKDDSEPMYSVGLTIAESSPDKRWDTIVCKDEKELIKTFALLFGKMQPDFIVGFNDTQYDWPFLIERAEQYGMINYLVKTMSMCERSLKCKYINKMKMKITADSSVEIYNMKIPGCVAIDARMEFMKLFPGTDKSSLKFYLEENGLGGKVDMPINHMFDIYETKDKKNMRSVIYYCVIDAQRCQELILKKQLIDFRREMATLSYTSVYDCFYYAIGLKVRNLLCSYAKDYGISLSLQRKSEIVSTGKFPGAFVFHPVKGLEIKRPVTGLDFSSLYPSVIRAYNLSPDRFKKTVTSDDRNKYNITDVNFTMDDCEISGHFIRHDNKAEEMGLFPIVLDDLFSTRKKIKDVMKVLERKIEQHKIDESYDRKLLQEEIFEFNQLNARQLAVKVFMNSFYGETGNSSSPFFLLELAGGTTSYGKYNIKLAEKFVLENGYKIKYGDTDSLYIICPDSVFTSIDAEYEEKKITRKQYWEKMIVATMTDIDRLKNDVNNYLRIDNGTKYLKMDYEEVLGPSFFAAKKKYCGIAHIGEPNFSESNTVFIRGIDIKKKNQSEFSKRIGKKIIDEMLSVNNTEQSVSIVVEKVLIDAIKNTDQWNFEDFNLTDVWKPNKQNVAVQTCIKRMKIRYETILENIKSGEQVPFTIPNPGERFDYIVTSHETHDCITGKTKHPTKGELMEFSDYAKKHKIKPDTVYYLLNQVVGICTRFICCEDRFQPTKDLDDLKLVDIFSQKAGKKYLTNFVKDIYGISSTVMRKKGAEYRKIWKTVTKDLEENLINDIGTLHIFLYSEFFKYDTILIPSLYENIEIVAKEFSKKMEREKIPLDSENEIQKVVLYLLTNIMKEAKTELNGPLTIKFNKVAEKFENYLKDVVSSYKNTYESLDGEIYIDVKNYLNDSDIQTLRKLLNHVYVLASRFAECKRYICNI
jgi:DNA polymerase elongation subunit (family B)